MPEIKSLISYNQIASYYTPYSRKNDIVYFQKSSETDIILDI